MDCFIISGMSGAGKSFVTNVLEDIGYYCIDNMPVRLIPQFVELFKGNTNKYEKVAFVIDVRGDGDFMELFKILDTLEKMDNVKTKTLFLEATNEVLIKRHKEKRRKHPLESDVSSLGRAVQIERELLEIVREQADYIVDTSQLSTAQLRKHIINLLEGENVKNAMAITVNSFGFKFGMPNDCDLLFDVRFLKNPYYVEELKKHTGIEDCISEYVFSDENTQKFIDKLENMLMFLIPLYIKEGKTSLVVSIGCTGGKHRSVVVSESVGKILGEHYDNVCINHRDIIKV